MVYKTCLAPEYIIWSCFQTALPFPEGNNAPSDILSGNLRARLSFLRRLLMKTVYQTCEREIFAADRFQKVVDNNITAAES